MSGGSAKGRRAKLQEDEREFGQRRLFVWRDGLADGHGAILTRLFGSISGMVVSNLETQKVMDRIQNVVILCRNPYPAAIGQFFKAV
jgi:hypothetical protein